MNKAWRIVLIAVLVLGLFAAPATASAQSANSWGKPGSYLVMMKTSSVPAGIEAQVARAGGVVTKVIPQIGVVVVQSDSADFMTRMKGVRGVDAVMHNLTVGLVDPPAQEAVEVDVANPPFSGDDDFYYDLQWGHDAVDSPEAWAKGFTGEGVRVAVLDTGFDTDHPDLAPNINFALSKSFVPGEGLTYALPDSFSHGSHTSGIIGAADNGFGTIGVAPGVELVLLKVLSDAGSGEFDYTLEALVWAADNGVDVANLSLGALIELDGLTKEEFAEVLSLYRMLERVASYAGARNMTMIASAGNDAVELDSATYLHFPSDVRGFVSVSATAPNGWAVDPPNATFDYLASYSNYGAPFIDVAGPGGDTAYPGNELCTVGVLVPLTRPCWVFDLVFSTGSNLNPGTASYFWAGGTSMAAPHATAVAALIIEKAGGTLKPSSVENILRRSAVDIGPVGYDKYFGYGQVNAYNAVTFK